jgi:hypothetical protein
MIILRHPMTSFHPRSATRLTRSIPCPPYTSTAINSSLPVNPLVLLCAGKNYMLTQFSTMSLRCVKTIFDNLTIEVLLTAINVQVYRHDKV